MKVKNSSNHQNTAIFEFLDPKNVKNDVPHKLVAQTIQNWILEYEFLSKLTQKGQIRLFCQLQSKSVVPNDKIHEFYYDMALKDTEFPSYPLHIYHDILKNTDKITKK